MPSITEKELLQFLKAIEEGAISLHPESDPQDIYAGNVTYTATNGWRITIFNDCNTWDYVDKAIAADGRSVDFDSIDNDMPIAREYLPADEIAWQRYGIPGYCRFRCIHCGVDLADFNLRKAPFLCGPCKALRKTRLITSLKSANLQSLNLPLLHKPADEAEKRALAQWGICVYVYSLAAHLQEILTGLAPLAEAENMAAAAPVCQHIFEWTALTYSLATEWRERFRNGGWEQTWRVFGDAYAGDPPRQLPIEIPNPAYLAQALEEYQRFQVQNAREAELKEGRSLLRDHARAGPACLLRYHEYVGKGSIVRFYGPAANPQQESLLPFLNHCLMDLLGFMHELLGLAGENSIRPGIEAALEGMARLS